MAEDTRVIVFYNAARAEIVQRLALREQVVLAPLTASGVIAGIGFRSGTGAGYDPNVLLLVPLLTIAFTIAFARHNWIIRHIGEYIATELRPFFQAQGPGLPDWDDSQVLRREKKGFLVKELLAFTVLLCVPALLVLSICFWRVHSASVSYRWLYWVSLTGTCGSLFFFVANIWRVLSPRKQK